MGIRMRSSVVDKFVGRRIREERSRLSMGSSEVAEALGISESELERLETGAIRVPPALVVEIARLFSLQISDLFKPKPDTH
jgi:DNA-binding XRE family transcriptional regulator